MSEIPGQGPGAGDECPGDEGAGDREGEQGDSGHDGETRRSHGIRTVQLTDSSCGPPGPHCRDCVRVRAESRGRRLTGLPLRLRILETTVLR